MMGATYLSNLLLDIKNSGFFYTESIELEKLTIHSVETNYNVMKEFMTELQKETHKTTFDGIIDRCRIIQKDCEMDDKIGKRIVNVSSITDIMKLIDSYKSLSKTITSFMEKDFTSISSLDEGSKKVNNSINDFDDELNEVFSRKDEVTFIYLINEIIKLCPQIEDLFSEKKSSKSGNVFSTINKSKDELSVNSAIVDAFHSSDTECMNEDDEELISCAYNHVKNSNTIISGFIRVSKKFSGKVFGLMAQHVKDTD